MTSLCVITPTIGRPSLTEALTSATLQHTDEWLVAGDGPQIEAQKVVNKLAKERPYLRYIPGPTTNDKGNAQRDLAITLAKSDYLLFLDDDDRFLPDAIETVREVLGRFSRPHPAIFRMIHPYGNVIWQDMVIMPGNVGGSMFVVPNVSGKIARWADFMGHGSDNVFIHRTLQRWQGEVSWCGDVIIECGKGD